MCYKKSDCSLFYRNLISFGNFRTKILSVKAIHQSTIIGTSRGYKFLCGSVVGQSVGCGCSDRWCVLCQCYCNTVTLAPLFYDFVFKNKLAIFFDSNILNLRLYTRSPSLCILYLVYSVASLALT